MLWGRVEPLEHPLQFARLTMPSDMTLCPTTVPISKQTGECAPEAAGYEALGGYPPVPGVGREYVLVQFVCMILRAEEGPARS